MASLQLPNCKEKSAAHKNGFEVLVMDNRLGGVDNICVLRRRTARNAVTRHTTGHSEGGRSAWHRQEKWRDFKTSVHNIVG